MSLVDEETYLLNMLCQFQSNHLHFRKQTGSPSQLVLRQSFIKLISNFIKLVNACTMEFLHKLLHAIQQCAFFSTVGN